MTNLAHFGAGGKMDYRLASNLKGSAFAFRCVETNPAGRERLRSEMVFRIQVRLRPPLWPR